VKWKNGNPFFGLDHYLWQRKAASGCFLSEVKLFERSEFLTAERKHADVAVNHS
jgi:hypothetical protein